MAEIEGILVRQFQSSYVRGQLKRPLNARVRGLKLTHVNAASISALSGFTF